MFNQQSSGNGLEVYFAGLVIDGKTEDLSSGRDWEGKGNQIEFTERVVRPFHDFGFTPTGHVTGKPGEIGGIIWRDEKPAYYAAKVGPLSLDNELFASGRLIFAAAGSDSAAYLGWFDSQSKTNQRNAESKTPSKNFLGFLLEGPSRVGHYFRPAYRSSSGKGATLKSGPIIRPDGKPHDFCFHSLPDKPGGSSITINLDGQTETMQLSPEDRKAGATFDRFGLFNAQEGGLFVELYLDDLSYTTTASSPAK